MDLQDVQITELKLQRKKGDWFITINGTEYGVDWSDEIYNQDWDYTRQGVNGKLIFLEVHDGDDPYFSSQKDADKQLMHNLTLTADHEFIRYMYAFTLGKDDWEETNFAEFLVKKQTA